MDFNAAKTRLEEGIAKNASKAVDVLNRIHTETPNDSIVRTASMRFDLDSDSRVVGGSGEAYLPIHSHALRQMASDHGAPTAWIADMASATVEVDGRTVPSTWQRELATDVLNRVFVHADAHQRNLVRVVKGEIRSFLSDRYRRLDSRPIVDAFCEIAMKHNASPYSGTATDTRFALKAVSPDLVQLPTGEWVALGVELSNSDHGAGALNVRSFVLRLWCLNGATREDNMKQVHLGRRLGDSIEFSARTLVLDTRATVSALGDVVHAAYSEKRRADLIDTVTRASAEHVDWDRYKARLAKALTKDELRRVDEAFTGPDVVNLPPEPTLWRVSNALSWIAHTVESPERKLQFERLAGSTLDNKILVEAV